MKLMKRYVLYIMPVLVVMFFTNFNCLPKNDYAYMNPQVVLPKYLQGLPVIGSLMSLPNRLGLWTLLTYYYFMLVSFEFGLKKKMNYLISIIFAGSISLFNITWRESYFVVADWIHLFGARNLNFIPWQIAYSIPAFSIICWLKYEYHVPFNINRTVIKYFVLLCLFQLIWWIPYIQVYRTSTITDYSAYTQSDWIFIPMFGFCIAGFMTYFWVGSDKKLTYEKSWKARAIFISITAASFINLFIKGSFKGGFI